MLEPTKNDILHPKTEKPQRQGRRGANSVKSNPIPIGWATHELENNYITEVLPQEWKFWAPCQAPWPGGLAWEGGAPRANWLWRPVGFDRRKSTGPEETETPLLEGAHKVSWTPWPRWKSSDLIGAWARPTCWYRRVSGKGRGQLWLTAGTETLVAVLLGSTHWHEPSWRLQFSPQDLGPPNSL